MSVSVDQYFGWTIELKTDLTRTDFDFYEQVKEKYPELSIYSNPHITENNAINQIKLVVDGMNGLFARLIYIKSFTEDVIWVDEDNDNKNATLEDIKVPDDIFDNLKEVYKNITNQELFHRQVKLKEWHIWG